ncbi:MAG: polysaccharide biosynthesis/export family protein [Nitrospinales bacterium]
MNRLHVIKSFLILIAIFFAFTAEGIAEDKVIPNSGKIAQKAPNAVNIFPKSSQTESFVLGPEDKIKIQVWGEDELTTEMPVRPDGFISFPLIGEVKAQGRTPGQLKVEIVKRLRGYLKEPNVVIIVMEINSINVSITGEVIAPGVFKVNRPLTLLHLFSMAKGFTEKAELKRSYVLRNGKKLPVNIYRLVKHDDFSQNIWLRHNDVVYIHENFKDRIHVIGEVIKPTIIFYREGMTLLDAVLLANGLTEIARPAGAKVYRKNKSKNGKTSSSTISVDLSDVISDGDLSKNITLKPGDIIHIPRAFF